MTQVPAEPTTARPTPDLEPVVEDWERALCVVAHPDDLEYGAAAAIAVWTDAGKSVSYVLATRGEAGIDGIEPSRAGPLRESEQVAAARCELEVLDVLRAWFLRDRVGDEFDGIVSGVIEEGFFVELLDVYVEGMVRVQDLDDDWYRFLPGPRILVGQRRKRRFAIGDPVRVAVQAVHAALGRVEFALVRGGSRGVRKRG